MGWRAGGKDHLAAIYCGAHVSPCLNHTAAAGAATMQVLYMSTCGMLWTGYLSYKSAKQ